MQDYNNFVINDLLTIYLETLRFFKISKYFVHLKRFHIYNREFWKNVEEHTHPYYELLLPLNGNVQYSVLNNPISIDNAKQIIIIPPGTPHIRNIITPGDIVVIIQFTLEEPNNSTSALSDALTNDLEHKQYTLDIKDNSWLHDIIKICGEKNALWQDYISNLMEKFFLELFLPYAEKILSREEKNYHGMLNSRKNIKRLEQMIEISLDSRLSLGDYSAQVGISKRQIERLIRQYHNTTFSEYLKQRRFTVAKKLLSDSMYSVKEIADAIGYDDVSYFCKTFKQYTGLTPLEYQKNKIK